MAVLHAPRLWGTKPIKATGTVKALAVGERVFAETGATPDLKRVLRLSIENDRRIARLKP
jgi:hypothetical protein